MIAAGAPTVYVVDDEPGVCHGLRMLFGSVRLHVASFASVDAFLGAYDPAQPGVLVLDVRMPGVGGMDFLDQMVEADMPLPVIILTGHGDVAMAVRAVKRGALEFIQKPGNEQALLDRVQEALQGNAECLRARAREAELLTRYRELSARERQVVERIAEGLPNREVALVLGISERTVETHRLNALRKLNMRVGAELIRLVDCSERRSRRCCAVGAAWCPACRAVG